MKVSNEILDCLRDFRKENGVRWKSKLRDLWFSGQDVGLLRQARNVVGPSGLDRVKLD